MAVECHRKDTTGKVPASGHDLHMDITGSIHPSVPFVFVDWFYPACGTDHHLVDDAAYPYPETSPVSKTGWRYMQKRKNLFKHKDLLQTSGPSALSIRWLCLLAGVFSFIIAIYWGRQRYST